RLLEDYVVVPRVLGNAVGLSPLTVLVAGAATGIALGGVAGRRAVPVAAVLATFVEVVLLDKDPAEAEVPTLLFTAKDSTSSGGPGDQVCVVTLLGNPQMQFSSELSGRCGMLWLLVLLLLL